MNEFFEWDQSKFGLNVPDMDREHQGLVACMNKLHALHESGAAASLLAATFNELANLTVKHFADEETYMAKIGFPGLDKHRLIHKTLLERVMQFKTQFEADGRLADDLFPFLKMWLKAHICGIDVKYAGHRQAA